MRKMRMSGGEGALQGKEILCSPEAERMIYLDNLQ